MKNLPSWMTTVTPVSKVIALILFIVFPLVGFYLGTLYPKSEEKITTNTNTAANFTPTIITTTAPAITSSIVTPTTVVPTTSSQNPFHVSQIVTLNFDGKFSPNVLNIYKNDIVLLNSNTSCIQFSTDEDKLNTLQDVGYTLIGKKSPNNPDGRNICGEEIADPSQSFTIQYKDTGKHKLYSFGCLNTQCLSVNKDVTNYVPLIINVQ